MTQFSSNKIFNHLERLSEWRDKGISRPVTYELDMTNLCDSRCCFCFGYKDRERKPYSIKLPEAKNIIKQIDDFGGKAVTFTGGGEPLCNPDTMDALEYAASLGLDVGFISNGIALNGEKIRILVNSCKWIRISLDAGSKKYYLISHGLDSGIFKKVVENTGKLVEEKRRTGSPVTIGTGFLTFPEMTEDMEDFIRVSSEIGVDYAQFRPLLKNFREKEINLNIDKKILQNLEKGLKYGVNGFNVLYSKNKYEKMKKNKVARNYKKCLGHNFATVIAADKRMYVCCHMRGIKKYCIGDLSKNSLREIWNSKQRREVLNRINFKDCPLLCRCDGMNEILWDITEKREHENFL